MEEILSGAKSASGTIVLPGDKSISHRSVIFNAVAEGEAKISGFLMGADCLSTIACMRALGVEIGISEIDSSKQIAAAQLPLVTIQGTGLRGLAPPKQLLDCGNSGTTMRLLLGLMAPQKFVSLLIGDESLSRRPMDRVILPLKQMGACIWAREGNRFAPVVIFGTALKGIEYAMPVASAQVKSALLLAGLYASGETVVVEPAVCRDHTERMLGAMGAQIKVEGRRISIGGGDELQAIDVSVPGDISSAAFWLVLGSVHPNAKLRLAGVGLNPTRTGLLDVLREMGAPIKIENEMVSAGEPSGDIEVSSGSLQGIEIEGEMIPRLIDEIPALAVAACFASGKTIIRNAAELRVKETDRIATTVSELSKLGAKIEERPDGMVIEGTGRLQGALVDSYGDHRLAMALGVAGAVAEGKTLIRGAEAVEVSYPGFWEELRRVACGVG